MISRALRAITVAFALLATLAPEAALAQAGGGEIDLRVRRVGVGNLARGGEWTPVLVEVTNRGTGRPEVILRVQGDDPDGDFPYFDRIVTANPGATQSFWLYTRLPYRFAQGSSLRISAHEAVEADGADGAGGRLGFRAGRLLGETVETVGRAAFRHDGVVGIVGDWHFGLTQYETLPQGMSEPPLGHERLRLAGGLTVDDIPDRWHGLMALDTLVWGSVSDRAAPGLLTPEKARAIRDWVESGGHLVVVLPAFGQEWFSEAGNPLYALLPDAMPPTRREDVSFEPYRPLLTHSEEFPLPQRGVVHTFDVEGAAGTRTVLSGPDGAPIVVRRLLGAGAVTVVGIDLGASVLRTTNLPHAEAFWHRVLGRRGQVVTGGEDFRALDRQTRIGHREEVGFDADIGPQIARTGRSVRGVLFGLAVFALYWLLAGPVGYALLGWRRRRQHAWVAFVATAGIFTGIAWLGAATLRPARTEATHLTMLLGVHGQEHQRARSWVSVMVPRYGEATLSVGDDEARSGLGARVAEGVLAPWEPSWTEGASRGAFPDNRAYRLDTRAPSEATFPVRATIKQFRLDWSGDSGWEMPAPVGQPGDLERPSLRFDTDNPAIVRGRLAHGLPGELTDVVVLVNPGQRRLIAPPGRLGGAMVSEPWAYKLTGAWAPGVALDLAGVTRVERAGDRQLAGAYFDSLIRSGRSVISPVERADPAATRDRLTGLWFFSQLTPPDYERAGVGGRLARRSSTHGLDLGRWMTEPCVIVVGQLSVPVQDTSAAGSPVPMRLDGQTLLSHGRTVVAWVYPMEPAPPERPIPRESGEDRLDGEG